MGRTSRYPEEFGREAVELYRSCDRSRAEVARSLGISDGSLAGWVKTAREADRPGGLDADERSELVRLRRENADLKMDREILGKAAAYFALGDDQVSRRFVSDDSGEYPVTRLCSMLVSPGRRSMSGGVGSRLSVMPMMPC